MLKIIKMVRSASKYIGAVVVMLGILVACCAGGAEDMETIKVLLKAAAIIVGSSLPFFAIGITLEAIMDRFEN